jgi:membrane-associated PAP2 superfamily phosphatase
VKKAEVPLYFLTAALGLYLAGASLLRGAKFPDETTWTPWTIWFVLLLVTAVYVPIYALYKALDASFEREDKERAEAEKARLR